MLLIRSGLLISKDFTLLDQEVRMGLRIHSDPYLSGWPVTHRYFTMMGVILKVLQKTSFHWRKKKNGSSDLLTVYTPRLQSSRGCLMKTTLFLNVASQWSADRYGYSVWDNSWSSGGSWPYEWLTIQYKTMWAILTQGLSALIKHVDRIPLTMICLIYHYYLSHRSNRSIHGKSKSSFLLFSRWNNKMSRMWGWQLNPDAENNTTNKMENAPKHN